MASFDNFFLQFFSNWDLVVVIGTFLLFIILGLFIKRRQMILFIFGAYGGWAVFQALPAKNFRGAEVGGIEFQIILFLALCVSIFLFLSFSRFKFRKGKRSAASVFMAVFYGLLLAGFLLSFSFSILKPGIKEAVSPLTFYAFVHQYAHFVWSLLPLAGVVVFK